MRIPGVKKVRSFTRWARARALGGAIILGYHRIATDPWDVSELCVSPENFSEQLKVLKKIANPISLPDMVEHLKQGTLPPRSVAVTFDDGYADNLYQAKPLLEQFQIPATVFVATDYLGQEFWWNELERYILGAPEHAGNLRLRLGGQEIKWDIIPSKPGKMAGMITTVANLLRPLTNKIRRKLLNEIKEWSGDPPCKNQPYRRGLNPEELIELERGELIKIGSHTASHPVLSELTLAERKYELEASKRKLEAILSTTVDGFSFPNGLFLESDLNLVSQTGYEYACTSMNGLVNSLANRFRLPRFWIQDVGGDKFLRWLKLWV